MAKALVAADLRGSTEEELDSKLAEAKIELFNLRFQAATGQLESHGRLRAGQRAGRDRDRGPQRGRRRPGGPDWTGGGAGPDRGDRGDDRGQEGRDQAAVAAGTASSAGEEG